MKNHFFYPLTSMLLFFLASLLAVNKLLLNFQKAMAHGYSINLFDSSDGLYIVVSADNVAVIFDDYPVSGGQKQHVAIAPTSAMNPDIMLFDEPTSALDPEMVGDVLNVMKWASQKKSLTE